MVKARARRTQRAFDLTLQPLGERNWRTRIGGRTVLVIRTEPNGWKVRSGRREVCRGSTLTLALDRARKEMGG